MRKALVTDRGDRVHAGAPAFSSAPPSRSCAICHSQVSLWRSKVTSGGTFAIDRCRACGYAFVNPRPSLEYLMQFYATSGHRHDAAEAGETLESVLQSEKAFPNATIDARRMMRTIRTLLPKRDAGRDALLDVGCGYGFFSREAIAAGFEVTAIELAAAERAIAHSIAGVDPLNVSFERFDAPPASYSVILMSQILEHALDVQTWLARVRELLHEGGIVAIALPNFGSLIRHVLQENDPFVTPPAHLNYFNHYNLGLLLRRCGFTVRRVQSVSRTPPGALDRRFGRLGPPVTALAASIASIAARAMDLANLGMMVNIYASKNSGASHLAA
jgi:SAM-dependent methyltransferase